MTLREVPVVFFAGILDELGPGFHESEYAGVLPWLRDGFRVLDGDFHSKPLCINSLNSLNHVHSVGMLMAYCVEARLPVKPDGVDHESVSIPPSDGVPKPRWFEFIRMLPIHRRHVEPGILFKKKTDVARRM